MKSGRKWRMLLRFVNARARASNSEWNLAKNEGCNIALSTLELERQTLSEIKSKISIVDNRLSKSEWNQIKNINRRLSIVKIWIKSSQKWRMQLRFVTARARSSKSEWNQVKNEGCNFALSTLELECQNLNEIKSKMKDATSLCHR